MKVAEETSGFAMDEDPLERAEIEIFAVGHDIEVVGFSTDETVVVRAGEGMRLPANAPTRPTPTIIVLPPLKPGTIRALLPTTGELGPISKARLAALEPDGQIVLKVAFSDPDLKEVNLRRLRRVAAQAAQLDRRLVIAFDAQNG